MISWLAGAFLTATAVAASPYRPVLVAEMVPRDCVTLKHEINWLYERLAEINQGLAGNPNDQFLQKQKRETEDEIDEKQAKRRALGC